MSKFLTFERKDRYSRLIALLATIATIHHIGPVFALYFFCWFPIAFGLGVVSEEIQPTNDVLGRLLVIVFFPTVLIWATVLVLFHIKSICSFIISGIKDLLMID